MQQEIFGPVLPVLAFDHLDEAIAMINQRSKPLACHLFSSDPLESNAGSLQRPVLEVLPSMTPLII